MWSIITMASSEEEDTLKFYFYAKDTRVNSFFCIEMHIDKGSRLMNLSIKAKDEGSAVNMKAYIIELLSVNELLDQQ